MLHGRNRPFPRSRGAPGDAPTQAETTSWQAQVVTNGGAVSAGRFIIVNNFIAAEKAAGTWALTDDYWGLWAEDTIGALTSLKQRRMGGSFGAPSFVPSRGYTFDGAANYVNTLFVPSTMALAMTGTNMRIAAYERTNVDAVTVAAGCSVSGTQLIHLYPRNTTAMYCLLNDSLSVPFILPVVDSRGYSACSINGTLVSNIHGFKNGIEITQSVTAPTMGSGFTTFALYIAASNASGTAGLFRAASLGLVATGASLTAAQEQAQYSNVQAWATAIGAQV